MDEELHIVWSPIYHAEWDSTPEEYVAHGVVAWGKSRRLARCDDPVVHFKAYVGVQHYDPARWYGSGEATAKFFLSVFHNNRTVTLRTFPTLVEALAALYLHHQQASGS